MATWPGARGFAKTALPAFSLVELLVASAVVAVLATVAALMLPAAQSRADRADALAKIRQMGLAVLHYPTEHNGKLPPLFPGQVLEYEPGRGGRIVTECADYLAIDKAGGRHVVTRLMPRAYLRVKEPGNHAAMRVYVMNSKVTNGSGDVIAPFGRVVTAGQPPVGAVPFNVIGARAGVPIMTGADQLEPDVATAPWKTNTPSSPPLGDCRAVFLFDGSAGLQQIP